MCNTSQWYLWKDKLIVHWAPLYTWLCLLECLLILLSLTAAVAVLLTVILIIIIGVLAVGGFFNYRRTGSILPALPKLPRYVSKTFMTEHCKYICAQIFLKNLVCLPCASFAGIWQQQWCSNFIEFLIPSNGQRTVVKLFYVPN